MKDRKRKPGRESGKRQGPAKARVKRPKTKAAVRRPVPPKGTRGQKPGATAAAPVSMPNRLIGVLELNERGFGFVRPERPGLPDVFVPGKGLGDALHGDRVEVDLKRRRGSDRFYGEVKKVIEPSRRPIVGHFTGRMVIPRDARMNTWLKVHPADAAEAQAGDVVLAEIIRGPQRNRAPEGRVLEVLGEDGDPGLESRVSLRGHGFSEDFPEPVIEEARAVPDLVRPQDLAGREDLRDLFTVTIDPERARDFDDALSIEKLENGFRVWVSIADVSHYVTPESAIDNEAFERGTSVYLPDRSVPMLPPELSSGLCSLRPCEDRLALTVEMEFEGSGIRKGFRVYTSVIRSDHRLTYDQVEKMAEDKGLRHEFPGAWPRLELLRELAALRKKRRRGRGAIDLDLPEAEVVLDEGGEVKTILRRTQTWSHQLVEEFMLAANEAVAQYLRDKNQPMIYRIHEPPLSAAVEALADILAPLGFQLLKTADPEHIKPRDYQRVIDAAKGTPYDAMVKTVCLRSMMQAVYSAKLAGHFGLASDCYCHFTSPIRRYPDLIAHRLTKQLMGLEPAGERAQPAKLAGTASRSSERERAAEEVEREMVALYRARWMARHLGEVFEGMVCGVTNFGVFVELIEVFVEGLVPAETLGLDLEFRENEMTLYADNEPFRIGDRVKIQAYSVDIIKRRINFLLLEKRGARKEASGSPAKRDRPRRGE